MVLEVWIVALENASNVHFGNHFRCKREHHYDVTNEGEILQKGVALKGLGRI